MSRENWRMLAWPWWRIASVTGALALADSAPFPIFAGLILLVALDVPQPKQKLPELNA
jgi:hypothetical protein